LLKKKAAISNWQHGILALGVSLCSIAVFLMVEGSILGERTTGIATVMGICARGDNSNVRRTQKKGEITEHRRMMA
jgi:hypothetical protein